MDSKELLSKVTDFINLDNEIGKETGCKFNIFESVDIEHDELKICLFLYSLLNPKSTHCQGTFFLRHFLSRVLNLQLNEYELNNAAVKKEYFITENKRRIDIIIDTPYRLIPIEVKINADDIDKQCYDYYKMSSKKSYPVVFYLTPDGREPSKASSNGLEISDKNGNGKIRCISFKHEISEFLTACLDNERIQAIPRIKENLIQFLETVKEISGIKEENQLLKKTTELVSENMKSALEICKAVQSLGTAKSYEFLKRTREKFCEKEYIPLDDERIFPENQKTKKHYWSFRFSESICKTPVDNKDVSASIQADIYQGALYYGISVWVENEDREYVNRLLKATYKENGKVKNNNNCITESIKGKFDDFRHSQYSWIFKNQSDSNPKKIFNSSSEEFINTLENFDELVDNTVDELHCIYQKYCK